MTGESRPRINTLSTPQSALRPRDPAEKRTIIGYSTKTAIWYRLKYESAPSIQELCRMPRHSDACYAKCPTWKLALPDAVSKERPLLLRSSVHDFPCLPSFPAVLTRAIKSSAPPKFHSLLASHPNRSSTLSLSTYSLLSSAPSTATAVRTIALSPSKAITSHTLTAISTPTPPRGPKKNIRIMGSKTS